MGIATKVHICEYEAFVGNLRENNREICFNIINMHFSNQYSAKHGPPTLLTDQSADKKHAEPHSLTQKVHTPPIRKKMNDGSMRSALALVASCRPFEAAPVVHSNPIDRVAFRIRSPAE